MALIAAVTPISEKVSGVGTALRTAFDNQARTTAFIAPTIESSSAMSPTISPIVNMAKTSLPMVTGAASRPQRVSCFKGGHVLTVDILAIVRPMGNTKPDIATARIIPFRAGRCGRHKAGELYSESV